MGTIANAKVTHYYNCYNGDFIGCLQCSYRWGILTLHAASLQKGEWMIIKIGCILNNTAYFLKVKFTLFTCFLPCFRLTLPSSLSKGLCRTISMLMRLLKPKRQDLQ